MIDDSTATFLATASGILSNLSIAGVGVFMVLHIRQMKRQERLDFKRRERIDLELKQLILDQMKHLPAWDGKPRLPNLAIVQDDDQKG